MNSYLTFFRFHIITSVVMSTKYSTFSLSCCCYKSFLSILLSIFPLSNMRYTKPIPFFTFQKVIHSTAQYTHLSHAFYPYSLTFAVIMFYYIYIFSTFNYNEIYLRGVNTEHWTHSCRLYFICCVVLRSAFAWIQYALRQSTLYENVFVNLYSIRLNWKTHGTFKYIVV